jgi:hypothetical protein
MSQRLKRKLPLNRLQKSVLWNKHFVDFFFLHLNSQRNKIVLIRKKLVIFVHFKGFNISQKPKSSPLSYFTQKTSLNLAPNWYPIISTCPVRCDSCSHISNIDIFVHESVSEIATLILSMSLNFIEAWKNDKWYNKRVLIWRFTLVLIKINYG